MKQTWKALSLALLGLVAVTAMGCDDGITGGGVPEIYVNPANFSYPALAVDESRDSRVIIENQGDGVLKLADFSIDTASAGTFALYYLNPSDPTEQLVGIDDTGDYFPDVIDLGANEQLTLILSYTAADGTRPTGAVRMITNVPDMNDLAIPISGSATGAQLLLTPSTIDFERVPANTPSTETVRMTNTGTADLVVSEIQINGSADFTLLLNGGDPTVGGAALPTLAPGDHVDMDISYTTPTEGPDAAAVSIFSNDMRGAGNPFESILEIRANGASPCIHVTPAGLEFPPTIIERDRTLAVSIESCGGEELIIHRIYLTDETSETYVVDPTVIDNLPLSIEPMADQGAPRPSRNVSVVFTPLDEAAYGGKMIIESNDPATPIIEIPIVGRGTRNECPHATVANDDMNVHPLDIITLDGSPSTDPDGPGNRPTSYHWTVVDRPDGSTAQPVEAFFNPMAPADGGRADDTGTPTAQFFVDLAGEYTIALVVADDHDTEAPSDMCPQPEAVIHVDARPQDAIHIQLVWNTPRDNNQTDDDGTDVDLHLVHPSGDQYSWTGPLDCYYANGNPDWGPAGPAGNPSLDIDDVNGAGPENINIDAPEDTGRFRNGYRVGLDYYSDRSMGNSEATVRVFLSGVQEGEWSKILQATHHFWEVANIIWEANNHRVQAIDRYYTCVPNIIMCP